VGNNELTTTKDVGKLLAISIAMHSDVVLQCGAHRLMKHIQGFIQSRWMPSLGKCLHCIAPAAAMVNEFVETTQNTNKHNF
jgi:hypothetical protein